MPRQSLQELRDENESLRSALEQAYDLVATALGYDETEGERDEDSGDDEVE